jgi:hypothetical protein
MIIRDNKGKIIDYTKYEATEVKQAKQYIKPDDRVLELGARWGGVSVTTNKILKDKEKHYVVECDPSVWDTLEFNRVNNNCSFNIIQGVISKKPMSLKGNGLATHTIQDEQGDIPNYPLPLVDFNVLIADCEGFIEQFYDENKGLFQGLRLILLEKDRPEFCDYDRIFAEWNEIGFKQIKPKQLKFHTVWIK